MNEMSISWDIGNKCNFTCEYCITKSHPLGKSMKLDVDKMVSFINSFNSIVTIHFTGGEPLMVDNIVEFISIITKLGHKVILNTNLMLNIDKLVSQCNMRNIGIFAAAHFIELDKKKQHSIFINNYNMLPKEEMIYLVVGEVAYQKYSKEDVERYIGIYSDYNIDVNFFRCIDVESNQVCEYTQQQIKYFNLENIDFKNFNGQLCTAGKEYFTISPNGDVYPCFGIAYNLHNNTQYCMGNIYSDEIQLNSSTLICPMNRCECPSLSRRK